MAGSDWTDSAGATDVACRIFSRSPQFACVRIDTMKAQIPLVAEKTLQWLRAYPGEIADIMAGEPPYRVRLRVRWHNGRLQYFVPSLERLFEGYLQFKTSSIAAADQQLMELAKKLAPIDPVLSVITGPVDDVPETKHGRPSKTIEVQRAARALGRLRGANEPWDKYIKELRNVADLPRDPRTIKRALEGWDLSKVDDV